MPHDVAIPDRLGKAVSAEKRKAEESNDDAIIGIIGVIGIIGAEPAQRAGNRTYRTYTTDRTARYRESATARRCQRSEGGSGVRRGAAQRAVFRGMQLRQFK